MRIVPQLASVSYSRFPALPAPRIAGLLPARVGERPPDVPTFTYANSRLVGLPAEQKDRLFEAVQTLLDVAIAYLADDLGDHTLNTALALFRRAATGQPMRPTNPAQYKAEMDAPLLDWLMVTSRRRTLPEVHHG